MVDTKFLIDYLKENIEVVHWYLMKCARDERTPSCTSFIKIMNFDWSAYNFSRKEITDFLKEEQKVVRYGSTQLD